MIILRVISMKSKILNYRIFQAGSKLQKFYNLLVRDLLMSNDFVPKLTEKGFASSFIENRKNVLEVSQMFKNQSSFFSCYLFVTLWETIISSLLLYYLGCVGFPIVLSVSIKQLTGLD